MDTTRRQMWQLNKYLWMSLAGVLLYIPIAYAQGVFEAPAWAVGALFGVALAEGTLRSLIGYWRHTALDAHLSARFNYAEIVLITVGIAISGGVHSDLWLLYFVTMTFESLYASRRKKRLLDLRMTLFYFAATLPRQWTAACADPPAMYARLFATHLFFLVVVSALARRISSDNEERARELLGLREQKAQSDERARIAREVHDSLGHALVSSILRLELAARLVSRDPQEAESLLRQEIPALRAAWNEGRDLAFHLRPWDAEAEGENIADLLRRHSARFAERTGLQVVVRADQDCRQPRQAVTFALTRIVQEALTNAARHAQATHVFVTLACYSDGRVECAIQDDGAGFEADTQVWGVGLQSMQERALALGGEFSVESADQRGTTIRVLFAAS